ncbi:YHYH domain-containing protein [Neobacillus sp. FSL H8-0543]|uniref:YHYH domain-containing protein n=1 Tax=Neobacillus sp. FSL H8-0543 TaxID=2954672 RepID=UPI003158A855
MKKFLLGLFCFVFISSVPLSVFAHSGRTDSGGGHYCWTNCSQYGLSYGQYHYHNGGSSSSGGNTTSVSNGWKLVNGKWYYYISGVKQYGWISYGGSWYWLDSTGSMKTGWAKTGYKWYYFNSNGAMKTGWFLDNSKWYYLASDGMATGWKSISNSWYFFDSSGIMKTGWLSSAGKWYYLKSNGAMQTGWATFSNQWYFFDNSGVMKTGWLKSGTGWYYLNSNGTMKTDWLQSGDKWYFLDRSSGKVLLSWQVIDGKTYYFYNSGVMAVNTVIEGVQIGADGVAITVDPTIENVRAIASEYGITVEPNAVDMEYDLYNGEEYIGSFSMDAFIYGDPAYGEMFKKIAIEMGVPATEAELNDLISQAKASETGEIITENIYILINETIYVISWVQ